MTQGKLFDYPRDDHENRELRMPRVDGQPIIDPTTQVKQMPGTDAVCPEGHTTDTCKWPFCRCRFPDPSS